MVPEKLKGIVNDLNRQGEMRFLEGATEEQLAEFEKANNVKLPIMLKEWFLFSDGGECFLPAGVQFHGIAHKPLIDVSDNDRPNDSYIVFGTLASGDPILFNKSGEDISIYNHEAGIIEDDETYSDFYSFLSDLYELLGIGG